MRVVQSAGFLLAQVRELQAGHLFPAAFQRPYVWRADDVEALWTSVLKGWTTGSLVLWTPENGIDVTSVGRTRIGPVTLEPGGDARTLVLDGQNRLATIAWSLLAPDAERPDLSDASDEERETWGGDRSLVLDLGTKSVRFVPSDEADTEERIPVAVLADNARMNRIFRNKPDTPATDNFMDWAHTCATSLREARTTFTVLERASPAEAFEAFSHVGRAGVPMDPEHMRRSMELLAGMPSKDLHSSMPTL